MAAVAILNFGKCQKIGWIYLHWIWWNHTMRPYGDDHSRNCVTDTYPCAKFHPDPFGGFFSQDVWSCVHLFTRVLFHFYAFAAYAATEPTQSLCFCLVRRGFCPSRPLSVQCPVPNIFLLLRKNTERISMKFVRGNCYHEHIKWLYFGRNWNRNKETGYERKFESTSIGFAAMSNRCRRLANETNSQISQRRLRQMRLRDTISRQFKDFTYVSGGHFQKDSAPTHRATVRSFSWCDTSTQH